VLEIVIVFGYYDIRKNLRVEALLLFARLIVSLGVGATRPFPRDGDVEELHGDSTVWPLPKVWSRGQK